ncbi:S8 family serine peptidase [Actinoplanes sp. GCM10030250]|uniref:S8 family serine peptidase n=1 Tax=Actinoplanes sp. GCM10030250 TaxID=3273376 RepID=UPI0036234FC6
MKVQIRRFAMGAVAASAIAAVGVFALPTGSVGWEPVTYGLTAGPEQLLPATVSAEQPARVVVTTVGKDGKPVISVKEATDMASAAELVKDGQNAEDAVSVEVDATMYALGVPTGSDPSRGQQWDFAKLKVADAWKKSTGAGVTVAVIDTGVDAKHPDLAGNVLSGYDAIANKAGTVTDANGHGTHVAGTIAAVTGNGVGVSGIAPDAKILPVKVLGSNGSGNMSDAAEGIIWAADHGAQVINMSLGSTSKVTAVTNAINYARNKGVTVVAAAGNSRSSGSPVNYPAADAGVIAVAATDSGDKVAGYSNAGSYVDVAAPGSSITNTYPTALGNGYKTMSGTSMASPHVAGVVALLKGANASLTPDQVEAALEKTAVDLGSKGFDNDYGNGRIDPVAALASVAPVSTAPSTAPSSAPSSAPSTVPSSAPSSAPASSAPVSSAPTRPVPTRSVPTSSAPASSAPAPTSSAPAPTSSAPAPTSSAPAPTSSAPASSSFETQVVTLTNAQRTANGCGPLRIDDRLTTAARAHSTDMAAKGFFSHTGSDGSNFVTRVVRTGYSGASAENIASGYRTPQEVVTGWMNSSGHRANILNCNSIAVGVGLVIKADGTTYWTQDFGRV